MTKIKIDPVTRIEGHLRIEAEVSGGKVTEAWAAGTMFRGIETIVEGRDPREAWIWAQRICGVCTTVHAIASVRAVEDAIGAAPPPNAELVRNLIAGSQLVHDHVIHFYHLHALDWVDVVSALKANPAKASSLAQSISDYPNSSTSYFQGVLNRLKPLAQSGQLSLFASGYWGHPAYKLTPEENLIAVAHYLDALEWQRDVIRIHAVLGGKNPHPQTFVVGGMATPIDLNSPQAINPERITFLQARIKSMRTFVEQVYIPDVLLVASAYPEWTKIGGGTRNFLTYGGYSTELGQRHCGIPVPTRDHPRPRSDDRAADEPGADRRTGGALVVQLPPGERRCATPLQRRDEPELHGARAAISVPVHRSQVQLAEGAALRRAGDGGWPARAHARRVCRRRARGQAGCRRDPEEARRWPGGAVLDARARGGPRARERRSW